MTTTEEFVQQYNEKSKGLSLPNILKAFEYFSRGELVECDNVFDNVKIKIEIEDSVERAEKEETPLEYSKKPLFEWTDELVAEFSRELYLERKKSDKWTDNITAELNAVKSYRRMYIVQDKIKEIVISGAGTTIVVDNLGLQKLLTELIQ